MPPHKIYINRNSADKLVGDMERNMKVKCYPSKTDIEYVRIMWRDPMENVPFAYKNILLKISHDIDGKPSMYVQNTNSFDLASYSWRDFCKEKGVIGWIYTSEIID